MIKEIIIEDDKEGKFTYTRDVADSWKWHLTWPGRTIATTEIEGDSVLYNVALAVTEGVENDGS